MANPIFEHRSTSVCICHKCKKLDSCAWLFFFDIGKEFPFCFACLAFLTIKAVQMRNAGASHQSSEK
jgi:hypothetical protein